MNKKIIKTIYSLSSGTIGALTGLRLYKELDLVVAQWVEFVEKQEIEFETWVDAWQAFEPEYKKTKKEK
jgi:hypothetical protein